MAGLGWAEPVLGPGGTGQMDPPGLDTAAIVVCLSCPPTKTPPAGLPTSPLPEGVWEQFTPRSGSFASPNTSSLPCTPWPRG